MNIFLVIVLSYCLEFVQLVQYLLVVYCDDGVWLINIFFGFIFSVGLWYWICYFGCIDFKYWSFFGVVYEYKGFLKNFYVLCCFSSWNIWIYWVFSIYFRGIYYVNILIFCFNK